MPAARNACKAAQRVHYIALRHHHTHPNGHNPHTCRSSRHHPSHHPTRHIRPAHLNDSHLLTRTQHHTLPALYLTDTKPSTRKPDPLSPVDCFHVMVHACWNTSNRTHWAWDMHAHNTFQPANSSSPLTHCRTDNDWPPPAAKRHRCSRSASSEMCHGEQTAKT